MNPKILKAMTDEQLESEAAKLFGRRASLTVRAAKAYKRNSMDELAELKVFYDAVDEVIEMLDREAELRVEEAVG